MSRASTNSPRNRPSRSSALSKTKYMVGWICALPIEMATAEAMLDHVHKTPVGLDPNSYVLGDMHGHNIVIAGLPAGNNGTASAASMAKDMLRSFKSIRFGLMVGIAGGAPSDRLDIRLGDVVVSQPKDTHGGVVQYDRGVALEGQEFSRTGSLNSPPSLLLAALTGLKAEQEKQGSQIPQYVDKMLKEWPRMDPAYASPAPEQDQLFKSEYRHIDHFLGTCCLCDADQQVIRVARRETSPALHFGTIASGSSLIEDAELRDRLRDRLGALAFEMEAAGLMQDYPCLVIRGICDYADSHKNDAWQRYAAATASAFAKWLLAMIKVKEVRKQDPAAEEVVVDFQVRDAVLEQTKRQERMYLSELEKECLQSFKTSEYERFMEINPSPVSGTCQWVLQHERYVSWAQRSRSDLLWVSADPGCGKSVLARHLVKANLSDTKEHTVCYFFFKDNRDQDSLATALCAMLHQLFCSQPPLLKHTFPARREDGDNMTMNADKLWRIFMTATMDSEGADVICVLDALDECRHDDRQLLIKLLSTFYNEHSTHHAPSGKPRLKFLVTSRPYQDIEKEFRHIPEPREVRLTGEDSNADISQEINLVIRERVAELGRTHELDETIIHALRERLLAVENRTYLWLHLVLGEMDGSSKLTKRALLEQIDLLPETVYESYERILSRVKTGDRKAARILLHIILGAKRPLMLPEVDAALQLATHARNALKLDDLDLDGHRLKERIRRLCGLFIFIQDDRVYMIHQTAKEFLVAKDKPRRKAAKNWGHSFSTKNSSEALARICVQYLGLSEIRSIEFQRGVDTWPGIYRRYPLLEYAALFWPAHFGVLKSPRGGLVSRAVGLYDGLGGPTAPIWVCIYARSIKPPFGPLGAKALHVVALTGHGQVLSRLFGKASCHRRDLISRTAAGDTPLSLACQQGHLDIVKGLYAEADTRHIRLTKAGSRDEDKVTPTTIRKGHVVNKAAARGHVKIVRYLSSVRKTPTEGALVSAVKHSQDATVRLLLSLGTSVDAVYPHIGTVLMMAVADTRVQLSTISLLVGKEGADPNIGSSDVRGERGFVNALRAAILHGERSTIELLLEHEADIKAGEGKWDNALTFAVCHGRCDAAEVLLDRGADINALGRHRGTALQAALVLASESRVVGLLLDRGADVNVQGGVHGSALQAALTSPTLLVTVERLINLGATVTEEHRGALGAAARFNRFDVVQLLLKKGPGVKARPEEYPDALQVAARHGHIDVVKLLLESGADADAPGGRYGSALVAAESNCKWAVATLLLERGATRRDAPR